MFDRYPWHPEGVNGAVSFLLPSLRDRHPLAGLPGRDTVLREAVGDEGGRREPRVRIVGDRFLRPFGRG